MSDESGALRYLKEMVSIPSVTGSESLITGYLESAFNEAGMDVTLQHVHKDRHNVIGTVGEGPIRLMLCTHMDVIPALDISKWHSPPFEMTIKDGKAYGRGTCDAKGSLAAMTEAMKNAGKDMACKVALAAVVDEEACGSLGAKKLLQEYAPEMALIGEPTGLNVAIAHKGAIRPSITVHGKAAHGSRPGEGVNAITLMGEALGYLNEYGKKVHQRNDPLLGSASFEVTMIKGGDKVNVIPEKCKAYIDRRLVRGETVEGAFSELKQVTSGIAKKTGAAIDVEMACSYPATGVDESEHIVKIVREALRSSGLPDHITGFQAGCDMCSFRQKDIPTVVIGPGSMEQAHVIDEYIELSQLEKAVKVYEKIISLSASF